MAVTKKLSKNSKKCKVTFTLPAHAAPTAKEVKVLGDFNNWNWDEATTLKKSSKEFKCQLELEPGQRYEFRYLIDNEVWDNDWKADEYVNNPYGWKNSVVITPNNGTTSASSANQAPSSTNTTTTVNKTTTRRTKSKIDFTVIDGVGPKTVSYTHLTLPTKRIV